MNTVPLRASISALALSMTGSAVAQSSSFLHLTCDFRQSAERRTAEGRYASTPARTVTYRIGNGEWRQLDSTGSWGTDTCTYGPCTFGEAGYRVAWTFPDDNQLRQYQLEISRVTGEVRELLWYRTGDASEQVGQCRVVPPPVPQPTRF